MTPARRSIGWLVACALALAASPLPLAQPARQAPGPAAAHRIVSVVPAVTEMLFAIGAGPDVVGVSSFDHYPPEVETRAKVGALIDPDFEKIISLKPDLVCIYGTQTDLLSRLGQAHLPVFTYTFGTLPDILTAIRALGARVGRATAADAEAARISRALDAIRADSARRPHPATALIFGRDAGSLRGMFASGGVGFLNDMLVVAGGTNVFADVKRESLQVSTEVLLARAPQVILELRPSETWTAARLEQERAIWKGLPTLPAVRANRVYILTDDRTTDPGPRVAEGAALMAQALGGTRPH